MKTLNRKNHQEKTAFYSGSLMYGSTGVETDLSSKCIITEIFLLSNKKRDLLSEISFSSCGILCPSHPISDKEIIPEISPVVKLKAGGERGARSPFRTESERFTYRVSSQPLGFTLHHNFSIPKKIFFLSYPFFSVPVFLCFYIFFFLYFFVSPAYAGDATLANQTTILTRIGTNTDAAGTTTLFARLASIDTTKIGTSSDTGANATLFGRIGTNTDGFQCASTGCTNETVFGVLRNLPGRFRNSLSQFGGDGSESNPAATGTVKVTGGIHQYAGNYTLGDGTTATSLQPADGEIKSGLYLFFKGSLTIANNAKIDVTGYGANGGNGGPATSGAGSSGYGGGPNGVNGSGIPGGAGSVISMAGAGGGGGGAGGGAGGGGGGAGGNGGNGGAAADGVGSAGIATSGIRQSLFLANRDNLFKSYGAGGGGGGGSIGSGHPGAGGGGGGGGVLLIRTHSYTNNGTVSANGGAGGLNGTAAGAATAGNSGYGGNGGLATNGGAGGASASSNGGGGGGGVGGGILYIEANSVTVNTGGGIYAQGANGGKGGNSGGFTAGGGVGGVGANGFLFVEIVP